MKKRRTKVDAYFDSWRLGGSLYQPRFLRWLAEEDPESYRQVMAMIDAHNKGRKAPE